MKRGLRLLGLAIAIAAGFFFLRHAAAAFASMGAADLSRERLVAAVGVMLLAYLAAVPFAALVWRRLLASMGVALSTVQAYAIIAFTQMGKYLPGNVAHHVGRVVVARPLAGDVVRLSLSLVYENLLTVLAAAHLTAVLLVWKPVPALEEWLPSAWRPWLLLAITLGAAVAFLLLPTLVARVQRMRGVRVDVRHAMAPGPATIFGCYLLSLSSFLIVGIGFTAMAPILAPGSGFPFLQLCGAFAAAWVVGLLVPGAPAGLGVREAVLLVLLGEVMPTADAVVAIALLRVATTLGDLVHFVAGGVLLRRLRAAHTLRATTG